MSRKLILPDENFGPLLPYIKDDNVTDINWNGEELWIDDLTRGRYCANDVHLDGLFLSNFTTKISNLMSVQFNKNTPLLKQKLTVFVFLSCTKMLLKQDEVYQSVKLLQNED